MHITFFAGALATLSAVSCTASPFAKSHNTGFSADVSIVNGTLMAREVPAVLAPIKKRCNECVPPGGRCTIGDGNCWGGWYCTWCGDSCKSICLKPGDPCLGGC